MTNLDHFALLIFGVLLSPIEMDWADLVDLIHSLNVKLVNADRLKVGTDASISLTTGVADCRLAFEWVLLRATPFFFLVAAIFSLTFFLSEKMKFTL